MKMKITEKVIGGILAVALVGVLVFARDTMNSGVPKAQLDNLFPPCSRKVRTTERSKPSGDVMNALCGSKDDIDHNAICGIGHFCGGVGQPQPLYDTKGKLVGYEFGCGCLERPPDPTSPVAGT